MPQRGRCVRVLSNFRIRNQCDNRSMILKRMTRNWTHEGLGECGVLNGRSKNSPRHQEMGGEWGGILGLGFEGSYLRLSELILLYVSDFPILSRSGCFVVVMTKSSSPFHLIVAFATEWSISKV